LAGVIVEAAEVNDDEGSMEIESANLDSVGFGFLK
jgi:hypothetical protein